MTHQTRDMSIYIYSIPLTENQTLFESEEKHGRIIKNCLSELYGHKRHEQFRGSLYY